MKQKSDTSFRILLSVIIFFASFLSFSVQPLFSKLLLPTFGGSAMVWTTSSLFFQVILLISYGYVFILEKLTWKKQLVTHISVLLLILIVSLTEVVGTTLSLTELPSLMNQYSIGNEVLRIIKVGILSVGTAFFFLGTVSTSLQVIAARTGVKNPYIFYRASNLGSFIGLFSFPFLIEPFVPASMFVEVWASLAAMLMISVFVLYVWVHKNKSISVKLERSNKMPSLLDIGKWTVLAAFPVALSLAVTNQITLGIAPIPYLWILPFGAYLLSYILAFGIYKLESLLLVAFTTLSMSAFLSLVQSPSSMSSYLLQVVILLVVTLIGSLLFHAKAYSLRPDKASLSYFYLSLAFGGMLGGLLISLVSPLVFKSYIELPLLLLLGTILAVIQYRQFQPLSVVILGSRKLITLRRLSFFALAILLAFILIQRSLPGSDVTLYKARNFYGTLTVTENGEERKLSNGTILHGTQYLDERATSPTTYYSVNSGVGKTLEYYSNKQDAAGIAVGVVGLGTGSIASYCQLNDRFVFYEINQQVIDVAEKYFTYLKLCKNSQTILGDARTQLAAELKNNPTNKYDVLVIDAFTDDAVPVHLLTVEAGQLFLDTVKEDGVVLYHISNRYLDLEKVLQGVAEQTNSSVHMLRHTPTEPNLGEIRTEWVSISKSASDSAAVADLFENSEHHKQAVIWTDNYSNILKVVRWR